MLPSTLYKAWFVLDWTLLWFMRYAYTHQEEGRLLFIQSPRQCKWSKFLNSKIQPFRAPQRNKSRMEGGCSCMRINAANEGVVVSTAICWTDGNVTSLRIRGWTSSNLLWVLKKKSCSQKTDKRCFQVLCIKHDLCSIEPCCDLWDMHTPTRKKEDFSLFNLQDNANGVSFWTAKSNLFVLHSGINLGWREGVREYVALALAQFHLLHYRYTCMYMCSICARVAYILEA